MIRYCVRCERTFRYIDAMTWHCAACRKALALRLQLGAVLVALATTYIGAYV